MTEVVVITGCSSGIGWESARYFAARGYQVAACVRNPDSEMSRQLSIIKGIRVYRLDVADFSTYPAFLERIKSDYSKLDVLINNAGYGLIGPTVPARLPDIERQLKTNLTAPILLTRSCLPLLAKSPRPAVIYVSSISGRVGFPYYAYYCASKFGLEGWAESLSHELAHTGIRVKIIEPGPIDTDFFKRSAVYTDETASKTGKFRALIMKAKKSESSAASPASLAARIIFRSATDRSFRLRYPVGLMATMLMAGRDYVPDWIFQLIIGYYFRHRYK